MHPRWQLGPAPAAAFFQDEWKATNRLTFGLRYNLELPTVESDNRYVYLDLTSPSPLKAPGYNLVGGLGFTNVNGIGRRAQTTDRNNFDPRLGLAYRVNDKTSIRGGFGIFHHPQLTTSIDISQGFTRATTNLVTQADTVTPCSTSPIPTLRVCSSPPVIRSDLLPNWASPSADRCAMRASPTRGSGRSMCSVSSPSISWPR